MFAFTLPKTILATALAVAALGAASVAQAGVFVPGKHPDAQKHPDIWLIEGQKHPDFIFIEGQKHPDFIFIEGQKHPDIISVLKKAPAMRKAGGDPR
jgi:hypothetical protein